MGNVFRQNACGQFFSLVFKNDIMWMPHYYATTEYSFFFENWLEIWYWYPQKKIKWKKCEKLLSRFYLTKLIEKKSILLKSKDWHFGKLILKFFNECISPEGLL